jgi:hypothetical protein
MLAVARAVQVALSQDQQYSPAVAVRVDTEILRAEICLALMQIRILEVVAVDLQGKYQRLLLLFGLQEVPAVQV